MSHPHNRQVADSQVTKPGLDARPSGPAKIDVSPTNRVLENGEVERDEEWIIATTTPGMVLLNGKLEALPPPNRSNR